MISSSVFFFQHLNLLRPCKDSQLFWKWHEDIFFQQSCGHSCLFMLISLLQFWKFQAACCNALVSCPLWGNGSHLSCFDFVSRGKNKHKHRISYQNRSFDQWEYIFLDDLEKNGLWNVIFLQQEGYDLASVTGRNSFSQAGGARDLGERLGSRRKQTLQKNLCYLVLEHVAYTTGFLGGKRFFGNFGPVHTEIGDKYLMCGTIRWFLRPPDTGLELWGFGLDWVMTRAGASKSRNMHPRENEKRQKDAVEVEVNILLHLFA